MLVPGFHLLLIPYFYKIRRYRKKKDDRNQQQEQYFAGNSIIIDPYPFQFIAPFYEALHQQLHFPEANFLP